MKAATFKNLTIGLMCASLMFAGYTSMAQESVKIGTQVWTTSNLTVTNYRNGDSITVVTERKDWEMAGKEKKPVMCFYDFHTENGLKHGALYNWYAVNDPRGLAPAGWHIPTNDEWKKLTAYLGGEELCAHKLKAKSVWPENTISNVKATNSSGFTALPDGYINWSGRCMGLGTVGEWWSSSEAGDVNAFLRVIDATTGELVGKPALPKKHGASVRCVKD